LIKRNTSCKSAISITITNNVIYVKFEMNKAKTYIRKHFAFVYIVYNTPVKARKLIRMEI